VRQAGILVGVLLLAIGAIGCGSGGGDTTITNAEFAKQADAICAKAWKKREAAVEAAFKANEKTGKVSKAQEEEQLVEVITDAALPPLAQMTEELNDLGVPASNAAQAEEMVDAFEAAVTEVEEDPEQFTEGKANPLKTATKLASNQKLKACADI
jgi:hypothetical protein